MRSERIDGYKDPRPQSGHQLSQRVRTQCPGDARPKAIHALQGLPPSVAVPHSAHLADADLTLLDSRLPLRVRCSCSPVASHRPRQSTSDLPLYLAQFSDDLDPRTDPSTSIVKGVYDPQTYKSTVSVKALRKALLTVIVEVRSRIPPERHNFLEALAGLDAAVTSVRNDGVHGGPFDQMEADESLRRRGFNEAAVAEGLRIIHRHAGLRDGRGRVLFS